MRSIDPRFRMFPEQLAFMSERVEFVFTGGYGPVIQQPIKEAPKMDFTPFQKIPRLFRDCVVTEKIDGTNACIKIVDLPDDEVMPTDTPIVAVRGIESHDKKHTRILYAGSRTRWITPGKSTDNFGFAQFVEENADELIRLGPGLHYGEWWGGGIQRGYGMPGAQRHFSLFNVNKWSDPTNRPQCCDVVPIIWSGMFSTNVIGQIIDRLRIDGSAVMPGFMNPEGIVVYHKQGGVLFKATLENDEKAKSEA